MGPLGRQFSVLVFAVGLAFGMPATAKADARVRAEQARLQTLQYYYAPGYYGDAPRYYGRPYWRHHHWRGYGGPRYWGRPRHYGPPPGYYHRHRYWYR
jgi:hypothetical protein